MAIFEVIRNVIIITGLGGVGWFLVWLKTRSKKITFKARVYQFTDATRTYTTRRKNRGLRFKLSDLKPYTTDILSRKHSGSEIIYYLQGLKIPCPEPTSDTIELWGGEKCVNVLLHNESATILRKGYDKEGGFMVFDPITVDETNMILQQARLRKDRQQQSEGFLKSVAPWIGLGLVAMTILGAAFFMVNGWKDITKDMTETTRYQSDQNVKASDNYLDAARLMAASSGEGITPITPEPGPKEDKPPSIE